jgi:plastocyanin
MRRPQRPVWLLLLAMSFAGWASVCAQEVTVTARVLLLDPAAQGKSTDNSNAVIWLTPLAGSTALRVDVPEASPHRFRLVQKNKRFTPHILVIPAGSLVEFPNLDPFFHNVFSLFDGKRFDLGLYEAGSTRTVRFNAAGISYIFCNIHPEMNAVVIALKTPYYGVSTARTIRAQRLARALPA